LGAQVVSAPGGWNFSDLHTPDRDAALAFYRSVFGWRAVDLAPGGPIMLQVPGYGDHLAATVDPDIHRRQAAAPPGFADVIGGLVLTDLGEPARWQVTFTVADRDNSAATVERLGGQIVTSADDLWSRKALIRDPQGAHFTISQFTPPSTGSNRT
ncbi:VOC family protein, partial [Micromonospora zhanjiangensis]